MISVIVPIYNSDKYLPECLDSLVNQTYQELEIILVDDGSQDQSVNICKKYAAEDKRISIIQQKNGGSTKARKTGLKAAKGEYIAFIDSDDWVELCFFERLYYLLTENNVDMVVSGCRVEKEDGIFDKRNRFGEGSYKENKLRKEIYPKMLFFEDKDCYYFGILQYLWNKLYKREIIEPCIMGLDERIYDGEDVACVFDACLRASGIYIDNHPYYHYRIHGNSVCTSQKDEKYFVNAVRLYEYMSRVFDASRENKIMYPQLRHFMRMFINNGTNAVLGFRYVRKYFNCMWELPVIPEGASRICIFGAGKVGRSYYGQLLSREDKDIVAWADSSLHGTKIGGVSIQAPENLLKLQWDLVIIAVKDEGKASEIIMWLQKKGISKDKIIWESPQRSNEVYEMVFEKLEGDQE